MAKAACEGVMRDLAKCIAESKCIQVRQRQRGRTLREPSRGRTNATAFGIDLGSDDIAGGQAFRRGVREAG